MSRHSATTRSNLTCDAFFRFCVMNTDLTYASKEDFQTDAQIAAAKQNGEVDNINYRMASDYLTFQELGTPLTI